MELADSIQGPVAVIGDVHGQTDKLRTVLDRLRQLPDFEQRWIVFIGDFVDRGSDPAGCIQLTLDLLREHPRTTALCGNHEYIMGRGLGWWIPEPDTTAAEQWIDNYDSESTFASYGVPHGDIAALQEQIPPEHRDFLQSLPWCVDHPQFFFVHAGLDPAQPFDLQRRILRHRDFSLTRPPWLWSKVYVDSDPPMDCPVPIVSGHVQVEEVVLAPRRILIDTTGGRSGDLSAVLLPERRVISSGEEPPMSANRPTPGRRPVEPTPKPEQPSGNSWWRLW